MRFTRTSKGIGVAAIAALALTACGSGGGTNANGGGNVDPNAIITAYSNEPQAGLVPGNTNEVFGGRVVDLLFQGLYSYDDTGKLVPELAQSVESSDSQNYTVKIKSGQKFTNGEAITAKTFVDTWNWETVSTNAQSNAGFLSAIQGYDDTSATEGEGDAAKPAPKAQTMSGLKVVDDTTFTIKLSAPNSDFKESLGYTAFYPMPSEAFKDIKAYGENPIGNGPYKMASKGAWQHDKSIALVKNDDYDGPRKAQNGGVTFNFYTQADAAYTDVQGATLDVLDVIPSSALKTYQTDLNNRAINKAVAANGTLNIPSYLPQFQGEAGKLRGQAISMAINRDQITKVIFNGARQPANELTAPTVPGYSKDTGKDITTFNVDKAKQLWSQANSMTPWDNSQPLTISYNTDGGNKEWVDAVANQLSQNLGIKVEGKPYPKFASMLDDRKNKKLTGLVRAGWQGDYPTQYDFLGPIIDSKGGSNYDGYSNPKVDADLKKGLAATSEADQQAAYNDAQNIAIDDAKTIPLWYNNVQVGWSDKVSNVTASWNGAVDYYKITKTK